MAFLILSYFQVLFLFGCIESHLIISFRNFFDNVQYTFICSQNHYHAECFLAYDYCEVKNTFLPNIMIYFNTTTYMFRKFHRALGNNTTFIKNKTVSFPFFVHGLVKKELQYYNSYCQSLVIYSKIYALNSGSREKRLLVSWVETLIPHDQILVSQDKTLVSPEKRCSVNYR